MPCSVMTVRNSVDITRIFNMKWSTDQTMLKSIIWFLIYKQLKDRNNIKQRNYQYFWIQSHFAWSHHICCSKKSKHTHGQNCTMYKDNQFFFQRTCKPNVTFWRLKGFMSKKDQHNQRLLHSQRLQSLTKLVGIKSENCSL